MKTYFLDTNFILRFFLQDNQQQADIAEKYFIRAKKKELKLFISKFVFLELFHILHKQLKFEKNELVNKMKIFLSTYYIQIEDREMLLEFLDYCSFYHIDFVDIMIYLEAKKYNYEILTFDKDFQKLKKYES